MPLKQKVKGVKFENEIVDTLKSYGLESKRAYSSNGETLGQHKDVDVLCEGTFKIQSKIIKQLPKWLGMSEHVDCVVFRENRGEQYAMIRLKDLAALLKMRKDAGVFHGK